MAVSYFIRKRKKNPAVTILPGSTFFFPTSLHANSDLLDLYRSAVATLIAARLVGANS